MCRSTRLQLVMGALGFVLAGHACAEVFSYECNSFPQEAGWEISQIVCDPELWLQDGEFFLYVHLCHGYPPPGGGFASYRRTIDEFIGSATFFLEFRAQTDAPAKDLPIGGGGIVAAGSNGGVNYVNNFASDLVELWRDNTIPQVFVPIEPGVSHTHTLEIYDDDLYIWYIDGEVVDSGTPEAPYPIFDPRISWSARAGWVANTTRFDYIRYGHIPADASGDFDSDGDLDGRDAFYFAECVNDRGNGPGTPADPGCVWADMDADGDVDFHDFALFQRSFTGPE